MAEGVSLTVRVRCRERERPTTSKPGPMLAEVAGTRMVNEREPLGVGFDIAGAAMGISRR